MNIPTITTPSTTIDLRGLEQVATVKEAEQYAALRGYDMFLFGYEGRPQEVDANLVNIHYEDNRLLSQEELNVLKQEGSWIYTNDKVLGAAEVYDSAIVYGDAVLFDTKPL